MAFQPKEQLKRELDPLLDQLDQVDMETVYKLVKQ